MPGVILSTCEHVMQTVECQCVSGQEMLLIATMRYQ